MKRFTQKPLQKSMVLTFIFEMRHQTTKSIKKFWRSCTANVARSANIKCPGTRLEVSGSQLTKQVVV